MLIFAEMTHALIPHSYCQCAGYSREVLFLTDGGVSGNEEERILSLVGGGGSGRSKVSPAPRGPLLLMPRFGACLNEDPSGSTTCLVKSLLGAVTCRPQ